MEGAEFMKLTGGVVCKKCRTFHCDCPRTEEEAKKAYQQFERDENEKLIGDISGWWYGKEDFIKTVKEYETENDEYSKVLIHWLVS